MAYLAIQILTVYLNYSSAFRFALDVKPFPSFRVSSNREDVIVGKYYNALGRSVGRSEPCLRFRGGFAGRGVNFINIYSNWNFKFLSHGAVYSWTMFPNSVQDIYIDFVTRHIRCCCRSKSYWIYSLHTVVGWVAAKFLIAAVADQDLFVRRYRYNYHGVEELLQLVLRIIHLAQQS